MSSDLGLILRWDPVLGCNTAPLYVLDVISDLGHKLTSLAATFSTRIFARFVLRGFCPLTSDIVILTAKAKRDLLIGLCKFDEFKFILRLIYTNGFLEALCCETSPILLIQQ